MTAGITQVRAKVAEVLDGAIGANVFLERSADEPINDSEIPAVVIRGLSFEMEHQRGADEMQWEGEFAFDIFVAAGGVLTITEQHAQIASEIVARIYESMDDPEGLGKLCNEFEPKSLSAEEDATADIGGVTLMFGARFFTRASDWSVIIGPTGPVI